MNVTDIHLEKKNQLTSISFLYVLHNRFFFFFFFNENHWEQNLFKMYSVHIKSDP